MKNTVKFLSVWFVILIAHNSFGRDYICYYMINDEIKRSLEENGKQKEMQNQQIKTLGLETYNQSEWNKHKSIMQKIKSRLNTISFAMESIPSSILITQEINKIYKIQEEIYQELNDAPIWIPTALDGQIDFIDKLQMNIRLMAGIILSYGTINQMEKADRKILLDFATKEFKNLRIHSWDTLSKIRIAKRKKLQRENMLANWLNKDKKIVEDIIRNAKQY